MICSILISMCVIGSLTGSPTLIASSAGMPTEVASRLTDVYVPLEDAYTDEELNLIYRVVQTEMGGCDTMEKSYVASVIFNMINHPAKRFGKTVKSVIKCPNRFCIGRHKRISESTKEAVKMAYEENTAPGCYAFHCMKKRKRFAGWTYKFSDKYGVHYYGE